MKPTSEHRLFLIGTSHLSTRYAKMSGTIYTIPNNKPKINEEHSSIYNREYTFVSISLSFLHETIAIVYHRNIISTQQSNYPNDSFTTRNIAF